MGAVPFLKKGRPRATFKRRLGSAIVYVIKEQGIGRSVADLMP